VTAPEPYANGTHLVVRGRVVTVTDHVGNSDGWRYTGAPADLAGGGILFSHEEAMPLTRPIDLMKRAGLDTDVYAQEIAQIQAENEEHPRSPLEELLAVVREVAHGIGGQPDIHAAWVSYREATP
jgi:hypothetical protein